jgi:ribosomal protein S12 methylthiotransferase accessory factor
MKFNSSPKIFENYKSACPKDTIKEIKKFLKKINLSVDYKEQKIERDGFFVYSGVIIYNGKDNLCYGKGLSSELCQASAYAELVERMLSNTLPIKIIDDAFYKKLERKRDRKVKIEDFLKNFNVSNVNENDFEWVEAFSLLENQNISIPYYFAKDISESNGLAAGNTIEEAVSQAFCEICERYSLAEHLIKKISANTVDKKTIKNKKIHDFIDFFKKLNYEVEIKDMTMGENPCYGCSFY